MPNQRLSPRATPAIKKIFTSAGCGGAAHLLIKLTVYSQNIRNAGFEPHNVPPVRKFLMGVLSIIRLLSFFVWFGGLTMRPQRLAKPRITMKLPAIGLNNPETIEFWKISEYPQIAIDAKSRSTNITPNKKLFIPEVT